MKVTRIREGVYRVKDSEGTWIARGGSATVNGGWQAFDCINPEECSNENNWAVQFDTFKQLKDYSQNN
tara:strand:- start:1221 stop:1424 length:204 start_codon:yes stop_codon:yes gene_type:complete